MNILTLENLNIWYPLTGGIFRTVRGHVRAVRDVTLTVKEGMSLGLVGESGCGKSSLGRAVIGLETITHGRIIYDGIDIGMATPAQMRNIRRGIQMIFQDPFSSLSPRMTVQEILREPFAVHNEMPENLQQTLFELLDLVGMSRAALTKYPHEFSGGQRQRIAIARAIALRPRVLVADEAVSALDVSIQSQILNLLKTLQRELKLTMLFIAHNLAVVRYMSDTIAVMYLGNIVETGDADELVTRPLHPYTKALISAIPKAEPADRKEKIILSGEVPSPRNPPEGCAFHTRCPHVMAQCRTIRPKLVDVPGSEQSEKSAAMRQCACHLI